MGEIEIGDQVSNPDGTVSRVIGVYPNGHKEVYMVKFDDGASCEVGLEHLWNIREASRRRFIKKYRKTKDKNLERWKVCTTAQLIDLVKSGKRILIPLSKPVQFTVTSKGSESTWPIKPYTLGAFLGDGHLGEQIKLTSADTEVIQRVAKDGYYFSGIYTKPENQASEYSYSALKTVFQKLKLIGCRSWEKFIPFHYKLAPLTMRIELLQGLMDTDGYADSRGHASYTTTSRKLANDVQWLARSLGLKANITSKIPTCRYKGELVEGKLAYTVWIKGNGEVELFALERKRKRYKGVRFNGGFSERSRKVISVEFSRITETQCIKVDNPNGLYLTNDFVVTHNSDALLMGALQFVTVPKYAALILRRTYSDLNKSGALIPRSMEWLSNTPAKWRAQEHTWLFPSGSTISFGYLENSNDIYQYQSSEYQYIAFDELTQFREFDYRYLFSRLRRLSSQNIPIRMRAGSNPGGKGHDWVKQRFMTEGRQNGRWFIPAGLKDNPHIDSVQYHRQLNELDHITRKQLEEGDWSVRASGGMFKREWFKDKIVDVKPTKGRWIRMWDLAASVPKNPGDDPDWTAGPLVGLVNGQWYIAHMNRFRGTPKENEDKIKTQAQIDTINVQVAIEQEPGSSGVNTVDHYARNVLVGYSFTSIKPSTDKVMRAGPFSSAAEHGNVFIVNGPWVNTFLDELDAFPEGAHDDQVDGVSAAMELLRAGSTGQFVVTSPSHSRQENADGFSFRRSGVLI